MKSQGGEITGDIRKTKKQEIIFGIQRKKNESSVRIKSDHMVYKKADRLKNGKHLINDTGTELSNR